MPAFYFNSSFGDLPLRITSIRTESGRDIAVQSPAYGDKHTLTDRGLRLNRTTCELQFTDEPGKAPYTERYDELRRMFGSGEVAIFSHPLDGQYLARCEAFDVSAEGDAMQILATAIFLQEDPPQTVFTPGAGTTTIAGPEAVTVAATLATEQLAALGFESNTPADIVTAVDAWANAGDGIDAQQVYLELATLTDRIDTAIADFELRTDLRNWQAYETMIRLRDSLRNAAESVTSADNRVVFDLFVEQSMPVIRICSDIYGAELAVERADQVTKLNRIRTPNLVPRGTVLKMPAVGA